MSAWQTIAYVLINTIIAHALFLFTMKEELRLTLKRTLLIIASLIAAEQLIPIIMLAHGATLMELQNIYFVTSLLCFLPTAFLVKRQAVLSAVFTFVLFGTFLDIATLLSETLDQANWFRIDRILGVEAVYVYQLCIILLSVPLTYLFAKKLLRPVVERTYSLRFWRYLWLVPGYYYLLYRFSIYPEIFGKTLEWGPISVILTAVWSLGTLVTYCIIFAMIFNISKNADAKLRLEVAQTQTKMQQDQYVLLQNNIEETRAARHDLRHHLHVLYGYAQKKDAGQIMEYIDRLFEQIEPLETEALCDNYAVNTILCYYIGHAEKRGIRVTCNAALPVKLPVPESDVIIVVANLLENALEACVRQTKGERFIDIKIGIAGNSMIALKIYNSFDGVVKTRENLFLSSKHSGMGIGTQSVARMTEKYNGVLNFEHEGNVFKASVLLSSSNK